MAPTNSAMSAQKKLNRFSIEDEDMSNHTQEPWNWKEIRISIPEMEQLNVSVAFTGRGIESDANARRIVACVNALEGLTTEQIEDGVFQKMREDRDFLAAEVDALTNQRDELLSALQGMIDISNDSQGVAGYHLNVAVADWDEFEEWQTACDAIAKAKGCAA